MMANVTATAIAPPRRRALLHVACPSRPMSTRTLSVPAMRRTLSILNCVIELRSSVYPGDPLRPRPLDARVSAALQNAPWPVGLDIQRAVAGYLAMARRVIFTTAEADQRNIRSAGLRTQRGPG